MVPIRHIRQVFFGVITLGLLLTFFSYSWLEKYFEEKEKVHLAALEEFEYLKSNQDIYQDTNEDYREIRDNEEELEFRKLAHDHIKIIASEENSFKARLNFEKETFEEIKKPELPVIEKDFEVEKNELGGVVLPSKELPWEEIKAKVEEKRAELTFEKTASQKILQEEKPFWEVDKNAGKSPVLLLNAKNDINEVSWEEPENIISIHELAPQINFNSAILERIIHLDFKGAPLKIEYLEKLFPKLAEWGATGLMIEYEDTFPYDGEFESVKGKFSFSLADIAKINFLASKSNLTIIPYLSVFDDLDFILEQPDFKKYREMPHYSEMISPLHDGSVSLAVRLIGKILKAHPASKYVHIGCRKPEMLGWSLFAKQWMHKNEKTANELYLQFVSKLSTSIRSEHQVNVLIWGNLILSLPFHIVTDSGIHKNVHLMLESYKSRNLEFDNELIKDLGKLFPTIWLAGSYKGTLDSTRSIPSMMDHARNVNELLGLSRTLIRNRINLKGTALMGYSRKHHSSSLTELFPVAIPTMICCLQALKDGELSTITEYKCSKSIGLRSAEIPEVSWPRPLPIVGGEFPGSDIWKEVQELENLIYSIKRILDSRPVKLYLTKYHSKETIIDIMPIRELSPIVKLHEIKLEKERKLIESSLQEVFYYDAIDEFLEEHVNIYSRKLSELNNKIILILSN